MFRRILADTSVWVDHFRHGNQQLEYLLQNDLVVMHMHVRGELLMGSLKNRDEVARFLSNLPHAPLASHQEVFDFVENAQLYSRGIGYTDAHLLASVRLAADVQLWTLDKRLSTVATDMDLAMPTA